MKIIEVDDMPHLCLFALKSIKAGTEIRYNYDSKGSFPWRKVMVSILGSLPDIICTDLYTNIHVCVTC